MNQKPMTADRRTELDALEHFVMRRVLAAFGAAERELLKGGQEFERLKYPLITAAINTVSAYVVHRLYPGPKLRVETVNLLTYMDDALAKLKARCREVSFAEVAGPQARRDGKKRREGQKRRR